MPAALLLVACSGSVGGMGGSGGGGMGGTAGAPLLPVCETGAPSFSVCVVSSADQLPLPDMSHDLVMAGAATVEAVGTGVAPARCREARAFGVDMGIERWFQVRTADGVLWTFGLGGVVADMPLVAAGDQVRLDLDYQRSIPFNTGGGFQPRAAGYVQLSDAAGTPLLWAGADSFPTTWLSLAAGQPVCKYMMSGRCPFTRYDIVATVNGSVATMAPFSTRSLGGYYLVIGEHDYPGSSIGTECNFAQAIPFAAAAVKAP